MSAAQETTAHLDPSTVDAATVTRVPPQRGFRTDIEGMRGIAVAVVVLYHAGVSSFAGGFVGVDVFFVLSGFLITGLLVDEHGRRGAIRFKEFYARRARRLLPASTLVFIATIAASIWLLSPLDLIDLPAQARYVAVFASNIWFSVHATDYLQPDIVSPFQQYWSLAVEEQFYLVWPLLLSLIAWRSADHRRMLRRITWVTVALVLASFALAVWWTEVRQPSAFFLLPARAWELGAGGLLAIALRRGHTVRRGLVGPAGLIGLVLVIVPVLMYDADTRFPGVNALAPVLGTVAVLYAGSGPSAGSDPVAHSSPNTRTRWARANMTTLVGVAPLRLLGRYSYSMYLWHWPLLVIPAAALERPLTSPERLVAVALATALSVATFHLVENRVRYLRFLSVKPSFSYSLGAVLIVLALVSTTMLPTRQSIEHAARNVEGGTEWALPSGLDPTLAEAEVDQSIVYDNKCHRPPDLVDSTLPLDSQACRSGAVGGPTVMLLGDSHAAQYQPAMSRAGTQEGWSLVSLTRSLCPLVSVPVKLKSTNAPYDQCNEWRVSVLELIADDPPDAVVLAQLSSEYVDQVGESEWLAQMKATVEKLLPLTEVIVLRDNPAASTSVPKCLLRHSDDIRPCAFEASPEEIRTAVAEQEVVEGAGGHYLDPVSIICPDGRCTGVAGDTVMFSDAHHLTATYSEQIAGPIGDLVASVFDPS